MDKLQAVQNKKGSRRERLEEQNRVQKVERLRKREQQQQKLVYDIYGLNKVREREESILERGGSENVENSEKVDCKA